MIPDNHQRTSTAPNEDHQIDGAFRVQWDDPTDAELSWEWDDMHQPQALTPLAGDYVTHALVPGFNYRYDRIALPLHTKSLIINGYAYYTTRFGVPDSDRSKVRQDATVQRRAQARVVARYWTDKVFPTLQTTYRWMADAPIETTPLPALAALWDHAWERMAYLWGLHFMTNAGSYQALNDLADLYESLVPGARPGDAFGLLQGYGTELQRVEHDLYHLAEYARTLPYVTRVFLDNDPQHVLPTLSQVSGGEKFLQEFQAFLQVHGHLGQPFDDLRLPSWSDEPTLVVAELQKRLRHPQDDPDARRRRLLAKANELADQLRTRLRDRSEDLARFEAALSLAREVGPLTEDHNYWLDRMLHAHARRFVLRVGARWVGAGDLEQSV
jgi:pyruvate,water dikinase